MTNDQKNRAELMADIIDALIPRSPHPIDPTASIMVDTNQRKGLLTHGSRGCFIRRATVWQLKFRNLGGGVWDCYAEHKNTGARR